MSLVERSLLAGEAGLSLDVTNTKGLDSQPEAFDEPILDKFCNVESQDTMAPSPNLVHPNAEAQDLPPKSALRASRMPDNLGLEQLGGAVEAAGLVQAATPHDVYLSSEEDASSDADDFSDYDYDYDYDSSVQDPTSPTRRSSHEDTARVVSVVFAGKPLIVDLATSRKRPVSTSSMGTRRTSLSTDSTTSAKPSTRTSSAASEGRPVTPASTVSSRSESRPNNDTSPNNRNSTLLSEISAKKKPPFLSIDPYANSSTYSRHVLKALDSLEGENPAKTSRTPTARLKGVTRSFSFVGKRSKPALKVPTRPGTSVAALAQPKSNRTSVVHVGKQEQAQQQPHESEQQQQQPPPKTPQTPITYSDILRAVKKNAAVVGSSPLPRSDILSPTSPGAGTAKRAFLSGHVGKQEQVQQQPHESEQQQPPPPKTPQTPITYNDIIRAVKKNATMLGAPLPRSDTLSPTSPGVGTAKRGILSGLAAKRRSVKLTGRY